MRSYTILILSFVTTLTYAQSEQSEINTFIDPMTIKMVSGYDQELKNAPASAIIITNEEIRNTGSYRLSDVLEHVTGLHISTSNDAIDTVTTIRGITSRFLILYNGVPFTQNSVNAFGNLDALLLHDVKYIELMKGPNSAVYGADAVIGTVNLVTYTPEDKNRAAGAIVGENNTQGVWLRHSDKLLGNDYSLYFGRYQTDGPDAFVTSDLQTSLDSVFGTDASNAPGVANQEKTVNEFRFTYALPYNLTWRTFIYDRHNFGNGVGYSEALDPIGESNQTLYTSELIYQNNHNEWDIDSNLSFAQNDFRVHDARLLPAGAAGGAFPDGVIQNYGFTDNRLRYELSGTKKYTKHTLRLGGGGENAKSRNKFDDRNYTLTPGSPLPNPLGGIVDLSDTNPIFTNRDNDSIFAYIQDEWQFADDFRLNTGIRIDDYIDLDKTTINPRIGLIWSASKDTTVKFLYGEAFRPPSTIESDSQGLIAGLGNPELDPVKLRMGEINLENSINETLSTSVSVYKYQLEDVIASTANPASPNGDSFVNLADQRDGYGSEISAKWKVSDRLDLKIGWAYQSHNNIDNDFSTRYAAKNLINIGTNYKLPKQWNLNISAFAVHGRERVGIDSRPDIDDYEIVNLSLRKKNIYKNVALSFNVQNIFDEDAREPISIRIEDDFPVYSRQAYLQLSVDY